MGLPRMSKFPSRFILGSGISEKRAVWCAEAGFVFFFFFTNNLTRIYKKPRLKGAREIRSNRRGRFPLKRNGISPHEKSLCAF